MQGGRIFIGKDDSGGYRIEEEAAGRSPNKIRDQLGLIR